jgi:hypothetical protein
MNVPSSGSRHALRHIHREMSRDPGSPVVPGTGSFVTYRTSVTPSPPEWVHGFSVPSLRHPWDS